MYELLSPVDPKAIVKYMGYFLIAFAFVLAVPMIAAIILGDGEAAFFYGITSAAVLGIGYIIHNIMPDYDLDNKEALIIAAIAFPVSAFISAIPMSMSTGMTFIDAFFESVSAVTTTGLSVAPLDVGPVFFFARSWSQWVGGIGIILVVLSILIRPGTSAFRIYKVNYGDMKFKPTVIATTRTLGKVYVIITLISLTLLMLSGMSFFDAICHAFSCVSTGGFSTRPESIGAFEGSWIPFSISLSCLLGAVSFILYPTLLKKPKKFFQDLELRYFLLFVALGTLLFTLALSHNDPVMNIPKDNLFHIISAITTAGFSTFDLSLLSDASKAVLIFMMWMGGNIGSTAGGIKIFRVILLFKLAHNVVLRLMIPKEAITPIKMEKHIVESDEIYNLSTYMLLYVVILIASSFIFMLHGVSAGDAMFEVSSALSTVGLSAGMTGVGMPTILKMVLCIDMLFGRIEIIPLMVLFMPSTWIRIKRRRRGTKL
ncbi:TrkH family potassium uptake protein [Methanolobus sp. ZRKC3]|uniref:TrkH family potassium uptake protein n=1 Tax=Methanolobus sp. ZRKC3 TaxID=3125786 RepID=UPI00324EBE69